MSEKEGQVPQVTKDGWFCLLTKEDQGETYAAIVRKYAPESISWNRAKQQIRSGKVFLDQSRITDPAKRHEKGKKLEVRMSTPRVSGFGELTPEQVLYVDRHIVVVDKPAELVTVSYNEEEPDSLEHRTRGTLQMLRKGNANAPLFLVHRLDKNTSGVLVFARSKKAFNILRKQFDDHTIVRSYRAIVAGIPRSGRLESWLVEDRGDGYRGAVVQRQARKMGAKKAIMYTKVLERFKDVSYVECLLETGRTHQIRIQLSEQGNPVVGDFVYLKACRLRDQEFPNLPEFSRHALHAHKIQFVHPITQKELTFTSRLHDDMYQLLKELRKSN